jgi:hypothetical protein
VLLLAAALTPTAASAACEGSRGLFLTVLPWRPDSQDAVTLGARGLTKSTCVPELDSVEIDHDARSVSITGKRPTTGCEPSADWISYSLEVETPVLAPGEWQLTVSVPGGCSATGPFTVLSAGQRGAGDRTAASLLFPYFQVDLDSADGLTTLLAIGNSSAEEALVHAVLWTDRGIPTLAFDLHLPGDAVQTLNLRDVFRNGQLPVTGAGASLPECASPIALPALGPARRTALRAQHTGQAHPEDGLCYGSTRRPPHIATGFVTVDLVNRCSEGLTYPTSLDVVYFAPDGEGLAASRNVLFGDYFYVDAPGDHAQGLEAVPIVADGELRDGFGDTFYNAGGILGEDRRPLPGRYRTRFLSGGVFDGNTSLIVWRWDSFLWESAKYGPAACGGEPPSGSCVFLNFDLYDEAGNALESHLAGTSVITGIYEIGGDDFPASAPFGSIQVENLELGGCHQVPSGYVTHSAWVTPILEAEGRYSVGLRAMPVE